MTTYGKKIVLKRLVTAAAKKPRNADTKFFGGPGGWNGEASLWPGKGSHLGVGVEIKEYGPLALASRVEGETQLFVTERKQTIPVGGRRVNGYLLA